MKPRLIEDHGTTRCRSCGLALVTRVPQAIRIERTTDSAAAITFYRAVTDEELQRLREALSHKHAPGHDAVDGDDEGE